MKTNCSRCKTEIEYREIEGHPKLRPSHCDQCEAEMSANARQIAEEAVKEGRLARWVKICPPAYLATRLNHPIMEAIPHEIKEYVLGGWQPASGTGLGICGDSGKGKTRLAYLLMHKLHMQGLKTFCIRSVQLCGHISRSYQEDPENDPSRSIVRRVRECQVLLLDDIGKERYTDRIQEIVYDIIEERTANLLPIIWTSNFSGERLEKTIGGDRGRAIVRRLREFSEAIEL